MVKAFGLIGITATLLFSQGCGGKKNEVASVPPPAAAAAPARPSMASGDGAAAQSNAQPSEGFEESSSGGNSGGMSGRPSMSSGDSSGRPSMSSGDSSGMSGGPSMSSGEGSGMLGGPSMSSGDSSGGRGDTGMVNAGSSEYSGDRGPNQASPNGMVPNGGNNPSNNQNGFGRGPNRPPRNVPPPTLKDQSVFAFQAGNPKRAFTLMESYALVVSDEEAADILKHYRWASQKKRPQLGLNIAVGVTVKNPTGATDLSPIGGATQGNGGGFGGSGGEFAMGGGMGGASARVGNEKGLAETTGEFGKQLVAVFKEKHESGAWTPAFSEYSLVTARAGGFGGGGISGAFGEGFSSGNGESDFSENGNQAGFSGGMQSGFGSGQSGNGSGNSGFQEGEMNSGGNRSSSGGQNSGGMNSGGQNSGGMNSGGNTSNSAGKGNSGGPGGSLPAQFQGKGGMRPPGEGIGGPGMGGPGMGGPAMGGPGMGGPGMGFSQAFAANMKLPPGSSPLAPCLTFIGVDETNKLMKKASQEGYDGLMLFEVTIGYNQYLQKVTNDTFVRVVQPSSIPKDVKRVYVSKSINNVQFAKSKAKGEPDGLEDTVAKIVRETAEGLALQSLPAALTPEVITTKRIPSLVKETETSVIDRLSEVNLYYYKGFIDEKQKADAFEQIAGQAGRVIASGSPSERLSTIEKLLEREFK